MAKKRAQKSQEGRVKVFVVRKYIEAYSAAEAISIEKNYPADDVWVDEEKSKGSQLPSAIGFTVNRDEDIY